MATIKIIWMEILMMPERASKNYLKATKLEQEEMNFTYFYENILSCKDFCIDIYYIDH